MQKIGDWIEPQKKRVADLLFSLDQGIGLSAWRFNIGAGINTTTIQHPWRTVETFEVNQGVYDWSRQEEERWFLQAAKERGVEQFIAFVNSPPARMTLNGYTNCTNGLGSTNLKDNYEEQFATYLVDILKHFRDEWEIDFQYISPVNEPQWEWNNGCNQEGNRASNDDLKTIVNALHDELIIQQVDTDVLITDSGDLRSWYQERGDIGSEYGEKYGEYLELFTETELGPKLGKILCGHSYWSDRINTQLVQDREALAIYMDGFLDKGWKYWMTEYTVLDGPEGNGGHGRDLTIKTALDVARVIHYDLTILQASAWQWWTAVSPEDYKDGLIYTDYMNNPSSQNIIESKLLWALGNYSRFIRPGYQRISLSGAEDKFGLLGSAFFSPDENKLIIVLLNLGTSPEDVLFDVSGLNSSDMLGEFTPYITTDLVGDDLKQYPNFFIDSTFRMPARSVVTLVTDIKDSSGSGYVPEIEPDQYQLFQNYPNPFNNSTMLTFHLPETAQVKITIFTSLGEQVRVLVDEQEAAGLHYKEWDGRNDLNQTVSSGVYVYTLQSGEFSESKKMIFVQ